jgi:hypothetical protein
MGFSVVDVAFADPKWHMRSFDCSFPATNSSPVRSCSHVFRIKPDPTRGPTTIFVMPLQPTKRGSRVGRTDRKKSYKPGDLSVFVGRVGVGASAGCVSGVGSPRPSPGRNASARVGVVASASGCAGGGGVGGEVYFVEGWGSSADAGATSTQSASAPAPSTAARCSTTKAAAPPTATPVAPICGRTVAHVVGGGLRGAPTTAKPCFGAHLADPSAEYLITVVCVGSNPSAAQAKGHQPFRLRLVATSPIEVAMEPASSESRGLALQMLHTTCLGDGAQPPRHHNPRHFEADLARAEAGLLQPRVHLRVIRLNGGSGGGAESGGGVGGGAGKSGSIAVVVTEADGVTVVIGANHPDASAASATAAPAVRVRVRVFAKSSVVGGLFPMLPRFLCSPVLYHTTNFRSFAVLRFRGLVNSTLPPAPRVCAKGCFRGLGHRRRRYNPPSPFPREIALDQI